MSRTGVIAFLVALAAVTFLDRLCISVAGPRIQSDLGISDVQWGWILGVFVLSYGLFEIPSGALGDRSGHHRVLTRIVLWWSVFTSLTGLCRNFPQLLSTRFLFGAGEAGAYPNAAGVIARWFPPAERGRAQGFIWAASRLGGALTPILVVPLETIVGWRGAFGLLGCVGLVWVVAWRWCYREPQDATEPVDALNIPWKTISRNSQVWLIFSMYASYAWGSWFFMSWFPTYLVRGAGFTEGEMGVFAALPFVMGTAGNLIGGFASDHLSNKYGFRVGRTGFAVSCLVLASLLIFAMGMTRHKGAIVVFSSLGFGVMDLMLPIAWAVCIDAGGEYAGVLTGIMNSAGQLGGFLCTVLMGYLVNWAGYSGGLRAISAMVMTSAVLFWFIDPHADLLTYCNQIARSPVSAHSKKSSGPI